jgi:hypothetical protein
MAAPGISIGDALPYRKPEIISFRQNGGNHENFPNWKKRVLV